MRVILMREASSGYHWCEKGISIENERLTDCERETHITEILLEEIVKFTSVLYTSGSTSNDDLHSEFYQFRALSGNIEKGGKLTK